MDIAVWRSSVPSLRRWWNGRDACRRNGWWHGWHARWQQVLVNLLQNAFHDFDVEQFLDSLANVVLGRHLIHFERVGVVARRAMHPFFGHQWPHDDLMRRQEGVRLRCWSFSVHAFSLAAA